MTTEFKVTEDRIAVVMSPMEYTIYHSLIGETTTAALMCCITDHLDRETFSKFFSQFNLAPINTSDELSHEGLRRILHVMYDGSIVFKEEGS